jgi:hypothetical protein
VPERCRLGPGSHASAAAAAEPAPLPCLHNACPALHACLANSAPSWRPPAQHPHPKLCCLCLLNRLYLLYRRYYNSEEELHRIFKSLNGMIFPGGLTDLWMDSPYVVAARKLWQWAKDANDAGGRCCSGQRGGARKRVLALVTQGLGLGLQTRQAGRQPFLSGTPPTCQHTAARCRRRVPRARHLPGLPAAAHPGGKRLLH